MHDARALGPSSHDPRWDGRHDALPFLTHHAGPSHLVRVRSGDTRRAARRPPVPAPVPVFLAFTRVSRPRYRFERATFARLAPREVAMAIDVHGSEDRAKDASAAEHERRIASRGRCMRFEERMRTTFPSLATPGHPLSTVRRSGGEETPSERRTDQGLRSDDVPRRTTPSRSPGCLPPFATSRPSTWISPRDFSRRPLAHAAHTFSPDWGKVPSRALQAPPCGHPRCVDNSHLNSRERAPLQPAGFRAWG